MRLILYSNLLLMLTLNACNLGKDSPDQLDTDKLKFSDAQSISKLNIDLKSPDNAVKSVWVVLDENLRLDKKMCEDIGDFRTKLIEEMLQNVKQVSNGAMLEYYKKNAHKCNYSTYSKEILEVKLESETRAIVFAKIKNITPIPEGYKLDVDELKSRDIGEKYKYLLEKDSQGWKVVQAFTLSEYAEKSGIDTWYTNYENKIESRISSFIYWGTPFN